MGQAVRVAGLHALDWLSRREREDDATKEVERSAGSSAGLLPLMAAARQYVIDTYDIRNIGGFALRNIAGTNTLSDHALGRR